MNDWISVNDRLPDNEARVWIAYQYGDLPYLKAFVGEYNPIDERWVNTLDDIEVKYWKEIEPIEGENLQL